MGIIDCNNSRNCEEERLDAQREEYFQMFLLSYLYYNIVNNCSRKIEIIELSQFFDKVYEEFSNNEIVVQVDSDFPKYAIHNAVDNYAGIEMIIEKVMKKDKYSKMFHISDEAVIIDGDFSFSPAEELSNLWRFSAGSGWLCGLKELFYISKTEVGYRFGTFYDDFFYRYTSFGDSSSEKADSVMQGICESTIKCFGKPIMSPESESIIISKENLELGKYLAYRFLYRCGKAWFRYNEAEIGEALRTPEVIFGGLSGAIGTKLDEMIGHYVEGINSKYLELSNRFAFLLQASERDVTVFDTNYNEYKENDAFLIGAYKYIIYFVDSKFQRFRVWKDQNGDVYLQDSVMPQLDISNMTEADKNYYFRYKDSLDKKTSTDADVSGKPVCYVKTSVGHI